MDPVVVRPHPRQLEYAAAALGILWLAVLYVGTLLPPPLVVGAACGAVVASLAVAAYALNAVTVTARGLVVQTGPRTREVPWEHVADLSTVRDDRHAAVRLHSVDGVMRLPAPRTSRWLPHPSFDARARVLVDAWRRYG